MLRSTSPQLLPSIDESAVSQFRREGFLKAGNLLSLEETATLKQTLSRFVALDSTEIEALGMDPLDSGVEHMTRIGSPSRTGSPWMGLCSHPKITAAAAQLCGTDELRLLHDLAVYKSPKIGPGFPWHRDSEACPNIESIGTIGVWIALDDVDHDSSCICFVPKSHLADDADVPYSAPAPNPNDPADGFTPVPMREGDIVFYSGKTLHATYPQRVDRPRHAYVVIYMPGGARYQPVDGFERIGNTKDGDLIVDPKYPLVFNAPSTAP